MLIHCGGTRLLLDIDKDRFVNHRDTKNTEIFFGFAILLCVPRASAVQFLLFAGVTGLLHFLSTAEAYNAHLTS